MGDTNSVPPAQPIYRVINHQYWENAYDELSHYPSNMEHVALVHIHPSGWEYYMIRRADNIYIVRITHNGTTVNEYEYNK